MLNLTCKDQSIINDVCELLFQFTEKDGKFYSYDTRPDWDCDMEETMFEVASISHGASKIVAMPYLTNRYVIKVPINGFIDDIERECQVYSGSKSQSYCEDELMYYQKAKEFGIEDMFAEVQKVETICNNFCYIQERVEPLDSNFYKRVSPSKKQMQQDLAAQGIYDNQEDSDWQITWLKQNYLSYLVEAMDFDIIYLLIDYYGIKKIRRFNTFCKICGINDLTTDNVGVRPDDSIVCFDFSGFNS